jgi:site-specific DNA recombinase
MSSSQVVAAPAASSPSKTAVTYLRVSTTEQAKKGGREEGFSIPAQRQANARKAESLSAEVVAEFIDAGESGTKMDKRDGLRDLLAYIRENQVDYCVVHKLDRLARSRADDVAIHFALKQAGVTLVSTSENIDETPSGMLMHGIMSSIAEFYSRNLANEVTKGLAQKASLGGTVTRAPLGYRNIAVQDEYGRINKTVTLDAERAHLITWAFYRYSEGDCSLSVVLDQLTDRGLTTRPTPKWAGKPLTVSGLHHIFHNAYYKGEIHYKGAIYPGAHEPLVDPQTWQQVQDLLAANNVGGTHQRTNLHYLRGSVYCGSCGSRLMITIARNKSGTEYPYLVCSGRVRKTSDCTRQAMLVEHIEELIEDEYRTLALAPELRDSIEALILEDFDALHETSEKDRKQLDAQRIELTAQRQKLLDAHYAGAIPIELLKTEQDRIARQLSRIQEHLAAADSSYEEARAVLAEALDLTRDCHAAYLEANEPTRRLFNQAFFTKIYIDEDEPNRQRSVRVDYNQPFDNLLARLVPAHVHHDLDTKQTAHQAVGGSGPSGCNDDVQSSTTEDLEPVTGVEPATSSLQERRSTY